MNLILLFLVGLFPNILLVFTKAEVEVHPMSRFQEKFPDKIALHFHCDETNMFAHEMCECHVRCRDEGCMNAKTICEKYEESHGCKYVFIRGNKRNRFATLKRSPNPTEQQQ